MSYTITGGITFNASKELPQKFKDWVKSKGILTPFDPSVLSYTNRTNDSWLYLRKKGTNKKFKHKTSTNGMEEVVAAII